jgi:putative ABC transport system substrate-binding protein
MNKRRKLLVALGASAVTVPFASLAQQQGKVWRIGFLLDRSSADPTMSRSMDAFKAGLGDLGYAEGKDYAIVHRDARSELSRLPTLAKELLALKVDLIIASSTSSSVAAQKATREIPIVFVSIADPVASGLAASLSRPGGNVTGLTSLDSELSTKRLELLRQILPGVRRVGYFYNPDSAVAISQLRQFESDCAILGLQSIHIPLRSVQETAAAFNTLKREKAQALYVTAQSTIIGWYENIIEQAAKYRLPAMYGRSSGPDSGGLIAYATNTLDLWRRAAIYADKIFKGAKPGDLPIEQPTKFELVVNMKTAKALGIKIPNSIMVQATKVIE